MDSTRPAKRPLTEAAIETSSMYRVDPEVYVIILSVRISGLCGVRHWYAHWPVLQ
jgi:hypothetical protein